MAEGAMLLRGFVGEDEAGLLAALRDERDAESVKDVVLEVGEGILAQEFEPTPSRAVCSMCDYRIVCPAAEG